MARIPLQVASRGLETGSMVNYSGVSSSPVAGALEGAGDMLQRVGYRYQQQVEEAETFEATQNFNQFKIAASGDLTDIATQTPSSGLGYHDRSMQAFQKRETEFLASVPERLKPKFRTLLETERAQFSQQQAGFELETRNTWYRTGLDQAIGRGQEQVYNNPDALEAAKQEAIREIDASGLPVAEKEAYRLKVDQGLAASLAMRVMQEDPLALTGSLGVATPHIDARGLVGAIVGVESSGNPNAVSPKGATGLMQVMPATGSEIARELGDSAFPVNGTQAQQQAYLKREDVSLRYGTHYMNKMLTRYGGDVEAALVAYNGGPARADAWLKANRDDSVIPAESANYYKKVLSAAGTPIGAVSPVLQSHVQVAKAFLGASADRDGGTISEFIKKATGVNLDPRQTAWCAAWLNAVFESQGVQGTGKLNARSFLDFGEEVSEPSVGDVVVFSRGDPNGWQGHVGLFAGYDEKGNIKVLGGNQSRQVSVQSYSKDRLLGFRRPPNVKTAADANDRLSRLPGGGPTGGMVVTQLDPRFASLPFAERLKIQSQAQSAHAQQVQAVEAQRKAEYTAYNDQLELGILTGAVTSEDQILMDPVLSDGDKATRLRGLRAQRNEVSAVDAALQDYIAGNYGDLNPLDSDQRKTANGVYDRLNKATQGQPDAVRQATTNSFIKQTGIIPDPVQADLRRGLYSNNPQDYASSLDAAGQIEDTAPIAFDSMPNGNDLRTELTSYRYMVNELGIDSTSAAQRLMERKSPDFKRNEQVWGQEADRIAKDLEATDVTKELNDGWIWSRPGDGADPTTQASLLAEYREAFKDRFIRVGGDEGEAKKLAMEDLKRTWGISEVSGDRQLMKFPPEKFYPAVDGGHAYLRDDAMTTALDVAGIDAAMIGNIMLRPSPATSADIRAGRPPRYRLFYTREENGQTIVDEAPGYWAMDEAAVRGMRDQAWEDVEGERQRWEGLLDTGDEGIASALMGETVPQPSPETAPPPLPVQGEFVDPASMMRGVDVFPNQGPQIGETAGDIGARLQQQGRSMREQNANR